MMTTPHSGSWVVHGFFCLVCVFILVAIKSICGWYLMYVFHVFCTLHIQHMFVSSDWCCACQIFAFNEKSRRIALLRVFLGSKSVKDNHLRSPAIFYMYSYMYIRAALRGPSARTGRHKVARIYDKTMYFTIFFLQHVYPLTRKNTGIYAVFAASIRKIVQKTGFWKWASKTLVFAVFFRQRRKIVSWIAVFSSLLSPAVSKVK